MMNVRWHPLRAAFGALAAFLLLAAGSAWADPPDRAIRLSYTYGAVSFLPAGDNDWIQARINRPLWIGDRLWTAGGARAELQMGNAALRAAPETSVSVVNFDDHTEQFEVTQGAVDLFVRGVSGDHAIEIDTPNLAFTIRRPGQYRIDVSADATTVAVLRGEGEAFGAQNAYVIAEGTRYRFYGTDLSNYEPVALERDAFDTWVAQRLTLEQRSASLRYVSPDVIGYQDLDTYGTWRQVPQYGEAWFPTRVAADWAPYHDGHWAWVDPWGWTWIDDAPWGFAPFHYGRWAFVESRWCWVPGPRVEHAVYAPALVAFVGGASFGAAISVGGGAVGWFPLGPGDVYRPAYNVSREYFTRVNVTNTTVNVTNITNIYNNPTTNVRYTNIAVSNAVTAVPTQAFAQAQPVQRVAVRVDTRAVQQAVQQQPRVVEAAPSVMPTRAAFIGSAQPAQAKPAPQMAQRTVVVKQAPPPAPASIQQREQIVQQQKKPIDHADLQKLAPAQAAARPNVNVVQPTAAPKPIPPTAARTPEKGAPTAAAPRQPGQPPVAGAPKAEERPGAQPPTQARPGTPGAPPTARAPTPQPGQPEAKGSPPQRPEAATAQRPTPPEAKGGPPQRPEAATAQRPTPPEARGGPPQRPEAATAQRPTPPEARGGPPQRPEAATAQRPTPPEAKGGPPQRPEAATAQRPTPPEARGGPPQRPEAATAQRPTPPEARGGPPQRPEAATAQRPTPPEARGGPPQRPESAMTQRPTPQAEAPRPAPPQAQAPRPAPQEAPRGQPPQRPPEAAAQHPPVAQAPPQPRAPEARPQPGGPPPGAAPQAQGRPAEKGPPPKSAAEREKEKQKEEAK